MRDFILNNFILFLAFSGIPFSLLGNLLIKSSFLDEDDFKSNLKKIFGGYSCGVQVGFTIVILIYVWINH